MKKERYWGVAVFSIMCFFISLVSRDITGIKGVSVVGILWWLVLFHALTGNTSRIVGIAGFVIFLQGVGGILFAIWLDKNPSVIATNRFGSAVDYLTGVGFSTLPWVIVYYWVKKKRSQVCRSNISEDISKRENQEVEPYSKFYDVVVGYPKGSRHSKDAINLNATVEKNTGNVIGNTENPSKYTTDNIVLNRVKAMMIIDYSEAAAAAWRRVRELPNAYRISFLDSLEGNPSQDAAQLAARLIAAHQKEARPYDDPAANDALEKARVISEQAAEEFKIVYSLLGEVLTVDEIFSRVSAKFSG